jgi:3-oxoadipate enol-lactonase
MKARVAGVELHYDARGAGPALVLLHGFPMDLGMWAAQIEALARHWQVIRFDARGLGTSAPGDGDGLLSMERIADDGVALLDHLGVGQAVVGGVSMGGYVAFAWARRHASRLRGLILSNTRAEADGPEARRKRSLLAEEVRVRGVRAVADAFLPRVLGNTSKRTRPQLLAQVEAMMLAAPRRGVIDALAGLAARADSTSTLREIHVPTLVITGDEDEITPLAAAQTMHAGIRGSRLAVLAGTGHLSNLEDPAAWNATVSAFLEPLC